MLRVLALLSLLCLLCINGQTLTTPAVTFGNVVRSASVGVTSFDITFLQAVSSLSTSYLKIATSSGASVSLTGVTLTSKNGGFVWTLSKSTGFYPTTPTAQLKVTFSNIPAAVCKAPVALATVTHPTTVVGTGTAASCTEAAFTAAVAAGGVITFNCGSSPVTITLTSVKNVPLSVNTVIDGKGLITLSGGGTTRILAIQTTYDKQLPRVTVQNLAFTGGYTTDVPNTSATNTGGGALYRLGGAFTIINCDFYNNTGPTTGQDVAGGAIYSVGGNDTTIVGSTFSGNNCSNGGSIGNLGNSFTLINSVVNGNSATGTGGNPGNGGNGGAVSLDGQGVNTTICGSTLSYNSAGSFGGSIFRVGYTYSDWITLDSSSFNYNQAVNQAGAVYVQALSVLITNSTIAFNVAPGAGGLALQYQAKYTLVGVTVANNTATTSLGAGISINSGTGTISDSTIVGNVATAAFDAGIAGGDSNTILTRSIVAYNVGGNIWVSLSCGSTLGEGGGNFEFPVTRPDGNTDTACSPNVIRQDPQVGAVKNNGCVTWTAKAAVGSPAANAGARCATTIAPVPVLTSTAGFVVQRGPFIGTL